MKLVDKSNVVRSLKAANSADFSEFQCVKN